MKAILLKVGIDLKDGALSPVWSDLSYSYLPAYYKEPTERKEKRTYKSLDLDHLVPQKIGRKKVHLDPEFDTFTYGDTGSRIRNALLKLGKGDLLVFYFSGKWVADENETGCYIFAYFNVKYVVDWNNLSDSDVKKFEEKLKNNAHLRSSKSMKDLVVVKGNSKSRHFNKCIPITEKNEDSKNPPYKTSRDIQEFLGIRENVASPEPIEITKTEHIRNLRMVLGIDPVNPREFEEKIPVCLLRRILDKERHLSGREKLFFMNFMLSKSGNYRSDAENFGTDMYISGYRNVDVLDEYFVNYYHKIRR